MDWKETKEELPTLNEYVLCVNVKNGKAFAPYVALYGRSTFTFYDHDNDEVKPTYWAYIELPDV